MTNQYEKSRAFFDRIGNGSLSPLEEGDEPENWHLEETEVLNNNVVKDTEAIFKSEKKNTGAKIFQIIQNLKKSAVATIGLKKRLLKKQPLVGPVSDLVLETDEYTSESENQQQDFTDIDHDEHSGRSQKEDESYVCEPKMNNFEVPEKECLRSEESVLPASNAYNANKRSERCGDIEKAPENIPRFTTSLKIYLNGKEDDIKKAFGTYVPSVGDGSKVFENDDVFNSGIDQFEMESGNIEPSDILNLKNTFTINDESEEYNKETVAQPSGALNEQAQDFTARTEDRKESDWKKPFPAARENTSENDEIDFTPMITESPLPFQRNMLDFKESDGKGPSFALSENIPENDKTHSGSMTSKNIIMTENTVLKDDRNKNTTLRHETDLMVFFQGNASTNHDDFECIIPTVMRNRFLDQLYIRLFWKLSLDNLKLMSVWISKHVSHKMVPAVTSVTKSTEANKDMTNWLAPSMLQLTTEAPLAIQRNMLDCKESDWKERFPASGENDEIDSRSMTSKNTIMTENKVAKEYSCKDTTARHVMFCMILYQSSTSSFFSVEDFENTFLEMGNQCLELLCIRLLGERSLDNATLVLVLISKHVSHKMVPAVTSATKSTGANKDMTNWLAPSMLQLTAESPLLIQRNILFAFKQRLPLRFGIIGYGGILLDVMTFQKITRLRRVKQGINHRRVSKNTICQDMHQSNTTTKLTMADKNERFKASETTDEVRLTTKTNDSVNGQINGFDASIHDNRVPEDETSFIRQSAKRNEDSEQSGTSDSSKRVNVNENNESKASTSDHFITSQNRTNGVGGVQARQVSEKRITSATRGKAKIGTKRVLNPGNRRGIDKTVRNIDSDPSKAKIVRTRGVKTFRKRCTAGRKSLSKRAQLKTKDAPRAGKTQSAVTMQYNEGPALFKDEAIPFQSRNFYQDNDICVQCGELNDDRHMCRQLEDIEVPWLDAHANQRQRMCRSFLEEPQQVSYNGCVRCRLHVVEDHACPETRAFINHEEDGEDT